MPTKNCSAWITMTAAPNPETTKSSCFRPLQIQRQAPNTARASVPQLARYEQFAVNGTDDSFTNQKNRAITPPIASPYSQPFSCSSFSLSVNNPVFPLGMRSCAHARQIVHRLRKKSMLLSDLHINPANQFNGGNGQLPQMCGPATP